MSLTFSPIILYSLSCIQYIGQETSQKLNNRHKKIILDGNWTFGTWNSKRKLHKINTHFTPDQKLAEFVKGDLVLEHVWWSGQFLQKARRENFTVGLFDYRIHNISLQDPFSIQVEPPIKESSLSAGSLRAFDRSNTHAQWLSPPYVLIQPDKHVEDTSFQYKNEAINGTISFSTSISALLHLKIFNQRGGIVSTYKKEIQQSDEIEIENIQFPSLYLWSLEKPTQVEVQIELRDLKDDSQIIDVFRYKTGFRDIAFENQKFYINQTPLNQLRAARLEIEEDWSKRLEEILQSGVQAVEIHGEIIPDGLLEWADRVGMGIVIVPRCIGRTHKPVSDDIEEITDQDNRLLQKIKTHPSVLFLVAEGEDVEANLISSTFEDYGYLVGGRDFPTGRLRIDVKNPNQSTCLPHKDCKMWITEITLFNHPPKTNWSEIAGHQDKFAKHAIGYVLPVERRFPTEWAKAFKQPTNVIKEPPQKEFYEGIPNTFMWLNQNDGVLFDETGLYWRYR